jgi:competence ComEA-like helix-hairpin-helix protein
MPELDPEGLAFRDVEEKRDRFGRQITTMGILLLVVSAALAFGALWTPSAPGFSAPQVRVKGAVPKPGWVAPEPLDVHHALLAAGMLAEEVKQVENGPMAAGWTLIRSEAGQLRLEPSADMLVFGLPMPLNDVDKEALAALPGIGPSKAAAIVLDRQMNGAFRSVGELQRVHGIGPKTVKALAPYLSVDSTPGTP